MRLSRQLGREDLATLRSYLKTRPEVRSTRRADYLGYFLCASFIGFGLLAIPLARWTANQPLWFIASPLIGLVVWHPIWRLLDRWALARFVASNKLECGTQEFWIADDGFGNSTPAGMTFHRWPAVIAAELTQCSMAYLAAGVHIYTIPFAEHEDEVQKFIMELKTRWEAAKGLGTPPGTKA